MALEQAFSRGCLYSTYVGANRVPVVACDDEDPMGLAKKADIVKVMKAMDIDPRSVRFKGCKGARFSTGANGDAQHRYVITYPTEISDAYLAPVAHELAHVVQMEMAGGLEPLRTAFISKKIELGADYLAGLVLSSVAKNTDANANLFQHSLFLMGVYVELDADAHGTPSQRTAAFRYGWINLDKVEADMRKASEYFQANFYATIDKQY
jgi:hypothetical protein